MVLYGCLQVTAVRQEGGARRSICCSFFILTFSRERTESAGDARLMIIRSRHRTQYVAHGSMLLSTWSKPKKVDEEYGNGHISLYVLVVVHLIVLSVHEPISD
jgi:hypothetical protein